MIVLPRSSWRADPPGALRHVVEADERTAFVVHWLGPRPSTPDPATRLLQAQRYHVGHHGWSDVGYNLAVGLDGTAWQARGWDAVGAHSDGWNRKAYGVVVLTGAGEPITAPALDTLARLFWLACGRAGRRLQLLDHGGTTGDTACAGPALRAVVEQWQRGGVPTGVPAARPAVPPAVTRPTTAPPYPGRPLFVVTRNAAVRTWQQRMAQRGWRIDVDGVYGRRSAEVCETFQREKRLTVDGRVGPITWAATWAAPVT